jgi:hypothetical protein
MRGVLLWASLFLSLGSLTAQQYNTAFYDEEGALVQGIRCGTVDIGPPTLSRAPYDLGAWRQEHPTLTTTIIEIPVAVHIVHNTGGAGNIPDSMVQRQIDTLNANYGLTNFRFLLAIIDRTANDAWYADPVTYDDAMKSALAVDPAHTLNLYTCGMTSGQSNGLLGYAYLPWSFPETHYLHGVVVLYSSLPGGTAFPYNLGKTATHEVGHYLGLYHTFDNGCNPPGDYVDDTPYEASAAFGCPIGRNTCPNEPEPDPIHNYMDYTDDDCMFELSDLQGVRMDWAVATYKPGLVEFSVYELAAKMQGSQVIPPVGTSAAGTALFELRGDSLNYVVNVSDMTGLITAVNIHAAPAGVSGPVAYALFDSAFAGPDTTFEGSLTLSDSMVLVFLDGGCYVQVETDSFPIGEIRGQIVTDTTLSFDAPRDLAATAGDRFVHLTWTAPLSGPPSDGYRLYRSMDGVSFDSLTTVPDSFAYAYDDTGLTNGTEYWYYLTALIGSAESDSSNIASATPTGSEALLYLNHTPGDFTMAIFNDGSIGADNMTFTGPGVTWQGSNGLFVGGLIFGSASRASVNGHIGSFSQATDMLNVVSNFAGGFTSDGDFNQITTAVINDSGAPQPYGVDIVQKSYTHTGDPFGFVRYGFVNVTGSTINDFYSGVFVDWDVDNYLTNSGGFDLPRDLVYNFDAVGAPTPYYGLVAIGGMSGARTTTASVSNPRTGSWPFITTINTSLDPNGDYRTWIGSGPQNLSPGDTTWFTFAVTAGSDLTGIRDNANAARAKAFTLGWTSIPPVAVEEHDLGLPRSYALHANFPNPFNPTTTIRYDLKQDGKVTLKVYNVLGQEVRTLVSAVEKAGYRSVTWDGKNNLGEAVSSGIYFYRLEAGNFVKARKMMLLK